MQKKWFHLSVVLCVAALLAVFACSALAVPAAPGTGKTGEAGACRSHASHVLLTADQIGKTAAKRAKGPMKAPSLDPAVKDIPLAVIVIGFNNINYDASVDWADKIFTGGKSLSEYYADMSLGQFTFTPVFENSAYGVNGVTNTADAVNDGVIHVKLDRSHDDWTLEYGSDSRKDHNMNLSLLQAFDDALNKAAESIDFAAYDVDGSGSITTDELAIGFVVAGYEASYAESFTLPYNQYLWSFAWTYHEANEDYGFGLALPTPDGVTVDSFIAVSEMLEPGLTAPISVLAHELGHYLGLPDLYETEYNTAGEWGSYDVDVLSVMCGGAWGEDPDSDGYVPYSMDAWSRTVLGWAAPEVANTAGISYVGAQNYEAGYGATFVKIPTGNRGEYYLLENRQFTKWDAGLAESLGLDEGGIILWHVDDNVYDAYNAANAVNNADHRPAVMPLFPEYDRSGNVSFIGKNREVSTIEPFFSKTVWEGFADTLGDALDLPLYGTGDKADRRDGRTLSGVKVSFLDDSADQMRISLAPQDHKHIISVNALQPATCTEAGVGAYECAFCGLRYADESGTVQSDATFVIPALGHTAPNYKGQCDRCGEQLIAADQLCKYCGQYHTGVFGNLVAFFHRIFYFFAHLFGRM